MGAGWATAHLPGRYAGSESQEKIPRVDRTKETVCSGDFVN